MKDLEGKLVQTYSGDRYLLTEKLGEGAQGVVYDEAMDKFLIKLYKKGSPIQNKNKLRKLQWLLKQDYPDQFIKPLDIIAEPYIGYVMKKVKGHTSLNKLLVPPRDKSFSDWYNKETGGLRRRLFLGYKIAMQFALLHESNRAYCDISGSNILVNEDAGIASVCMIDIDNIYIPGGDSGNVLGTSRYMAPEIINKQMEPDIFTDDYSLAVILFELLKVGHPYVGDMVEDGSPEMQTQAYLGLYPYVDDKNTDINRSSQMLPSEVVMTKRLMQLFERTFVNGKDNRMERVPAREFALACLEASNKVMKCPVCGNWHIAVANGSHEYVCPWCDDVNPRPMFLQFKDRYDVDVPGTLVVGEKVKQDIAVNSFVLRDEVNTITDNYISNMYIKRDKFSKPVDQYFVIRKAKDGKFYLVNNENKELYVQKAKRENFVLVTKDCPMEIGKGDRIYFENISKKNKELLKESKGKYKGILFRYAVVR